MRVALVCGLAMAAAVAAGFAADAPDWRKDVQLRAMGDELARSKTLTLNQLDKPYFIQYATEDSELSIVSASLGGLTHSSQFRLRHPRVVVRVGDYGFDDTNSVYSGTRQFGLFPLDDDYGVMRTILWRTTDAFYKAALSQIAQKRNALREVADPDKTPDLAQTKAVQVLERQKPVSIDQKTWENWLRDASAQFAAHPAVMTSSVRFQAIGSTYRLVNSEGTVVRTPENLAGLEIRGSARTSDGRRVSNQFFSAALDPANLPQAEQLSQIATKVAGETELLTKAPLGEDYSGPVLFEREAAAQMMAQILTETLVLHRKPVAPPNANSAALQSPESVWAARVSSKVAPEWLTIFDNPLLESYHGTKLAGSYKMDEEGVPAERVSVVDKGTLKGFLLSRQPVRNMNGSNGHGRLPGPFGSELAAIGNLIVEASSTVSESQLKQKLIEKVKAGGLKYGVLIRRLDFPSTATMSELQGIARQAQANGYARTLNQPLLAYKIWPDGREELVRGLRFQEFSAKDLRDLDGAANEPYVFNYLNNGSSLNLADFSSSLVASSVACPSLLFDSIALTRAENEGDLAPVVPPPALIAQQ